MKFSDNQESFFVPIVICEPPGRLGHDKREYEDRDNEDTVDDSFSPLLGLESKQRCSQLKGNWESPAELVVVFGRGSIIDPV